MAKNKEDINENGQFIPKRGNFTIVTNKVLYDSNLSLGALGLYIKIAQKITIPGYILYKSQIQKSTKIGEPGKERILGVRAFNTVWKELKARGYLKQFRIRRPKGFIYQYILLDEPDLSTKPLINVCLDEEIVDGVVKKVVIEEVVTTNDMEQVDQLDLVGKKKDFEIQVPLLKTEEEVKEIEVYYEKIQEEVAEENLEINRELFEIEDEKIIVDSKNNSEDMPIKHTENEVVSNYREMIEDNIDYETLASKGKRVQSMTDDVVSIMLDTITMPTNASVKIGPSNKPVEAVKSILLRADQMSVSKTIQTILNFKNPIKNLKGFTLTTLYNNILTSSTYQERNFNKSYHGDETDEDYLESLGMGT